MAFQLVIMRKMLKNSLTVTLPKNYLLLQNVSTAGHMTTSCIPVNHVSSRTPV